MVMPSQVHFQFQFPKESACSLRVVAEDILGNWQLQKRAHEFLSTPDGIAILANLCNAAAKRYDERYYEYKPLLVQLLVKHHPDVWQEAGVVYVETTLAQVSFHVFDGEDGMVPARPDKQWDGLHLQPIAGVLALAYLNGATKHVRDLSRTLVEKEAICQKR